MQFKKSTTFWYIYNGLFLILRWNWIVWQRLIPSAFAAQLILYTTWKLTTQWGKWENLLSLCDGQNTYTIFFRSSLFLYILVLNVRCTWKLFLYKMDPYTYVHICLYVCILYMGRYMSRDLNRKSDFQSTHTECEFCGKFVRQTVLWISINLERFL